jgi:hypothetical protein
MNDLDRKRQLTAARVRRYRARQKELAEHEAYVLEQQVRWYADRLMTEHPEVVPILAEIPFVNELKERLAGRDTWKGC